MPSVTITAFEVDPEGPIRVRFGKRGREFNDLAHLRAVLSEIDNRETLELIALWIATRRQPALGNPSAFVGRTLEIDPSKANWGSLG